MYYIIVWQTREDCQAIFYLLAGSVTDRLGLSGAGE